MKKKIISLMLCAAMVFTLASCGGNAGGDTPTDAPDDKQTTAGEVEEDTKTDTKTDGEDVTIGLSVGHLTEERWQREIEMFKAYCAEHNITLEVQSAEDDPQKQVSQCENMLAKGVDALIVQPIDSEAAGAVIAPAKAANVPVISYDRFIMNGDLDYYISFDTIKVGKAEAQFVVDKVNKGNFVWLKGDPADFNAKLLEIGQKEVLDPLVEAGDVTVVAEQWCKGWDPNEALKHMENALTANQNDVQAVIASNDGTAGGAIQALNAQSLAGIVPIAGQDADLAACQRIVEGTQTGTVYKPLKKLNDACIQLAHALALGQTPEEAEAAIDSNLGTWSTLDNNYKEVKTFMVDVVAVDKDNMIEEIVKDGFHSYDDVYANVSESERPAKP